MGYDSRRLTNNQAQQPPQVIVNINGENGVSTSYKSSDIADDISANSTNEAIATEKIDRRILKLCMSKGEVT